MYYFYDTVNIILIVDLGKKFLGYHYQKVLCDFVKIFSSEEMQNLLFFRARYINIPMCSSV